MAIEQATITWIHLTTAALWVGGSLFIGAVLAPFLKSMLKSPEERLQIMIKIGRRFNRIAVPSLIILIGTGIYQSNSLLMNTDFLFSTNYGNILLVKIILALTLIGIYTIHVRIIRKEVEDQIISNKMSQEQVQKIRSKIIILGQTIVILSVIILFLAALLKSGI